MAVFMMNWLLACAKSFKVTVILPDTVLVPEELNTALTKDSEYYKVDQLPIHRFLDKQFINFFVKSGQLFALSVGTQLDTDDCAAATPCGHLVLNLRKDTYNTLGLQGTQSKFSTERYAVIHAIDMFGYGSVGDVELTNRRSKLDKGAPVPLPLSEGCL
ncbi:Ribonuclease P protein subunit p40 [Homalodisca vitripennis]|nr:Ribonuclease P protein subunit p40 [Homalodisca vitripennis]